MLGLNTRHALAYVKEDNKMYMLCELVSKGKKHQPETIMYQDPNTGTINCKHCISVFHKYLLDEKDKGKLSQGKVVKNVSGKRVKKGERIAPDELVFLCLRFFSGSIFSILF